MPLSLLAPAFQHMETMPAQYTCEGADISPALRWSGVPDDATSLVLIVDDPDAPDPKAPRRIWVHWVLYNLPPTATELPEAVSSAQLPTGTAEGINDWRRTGYGGPCPPIGRHRYFFRLYALDTMLHPSDAPSRTTLLSAMEGHVLSKTELVGTYEKHK